jgi:hypothetical protein
MGGDVEVVGVVEVVEVVEAVDRAVATTTTTAEQYRSTTQPQPGMPILL